MPLLLRNIKKLLTMEGDAQNPLGIIQNAAVIIDGNYIVWVGEEACVPYAVLNTLDCLGGAVIPGLVDCHTHLVFAGSRSDEFVLRAQGATYQEIMYAGGGILNTMHATRWASKEELIALALPRLSRMLSYGVTSIEAKTGYGLSLLDELKMLEVMDALNQLQPISICPTFLGAHAIPPEYADCPDSYVDHLVDEMIPQIKLQGIARFCDVFVESGAFNGEQGLRILSAAKTAGLSCKVHADQLSHSGGARLAAQVAAVSASHLEYATDDDKKALAESHVIAEILPTSQEFLGLPKMVSARSLIESGLKVAVATDFNPGSAMCDNLHWAARFSVTRCGLSCEEALLGITLHAANSVGCDDVGKIQIGKKADFCILSTSNPWDLFYDWSLNPIRTVFKNGQEVYQSK
jgi:imidazolonepropionase